MHIYQTSTHIWRIDFKTSQLIEWDLRRRRSSKKLFHTCGYCLWSDERRERNSNHVNANSTLIYIVSMQIASVHGPKLNQCMKISLTRNHKKWKYSWDSPVSSHVLRKPSKIVNLFMTSFYLYFFGMRWSIVWSTVFKARIAEVKKKWLFKAKLDSINHVKEFAA